MSNLETRRLSFYKRDCETYRFAVGLAISISLSSLAWVNIFEERNEHEKAKSGFGNLILSNGYSLK